MLNWAKVIGFNKLSLSLIAWIILTLPTASVMAKDYASKIEKIEVTDAKDQLHVNVRMRYVISPMAKLAIVKGVPLSWILKIELQKKNLFWTTVVSRRSITFVIRFDALLNLYTVENVDADTIEQFASFNTAIQAISDIQKITLPKSTHEKRRYQLALKLQFDREFLPTPLRPESYFKEDWAMSSDWFIWPL